MDNLNLNNPIFVYYLHVGGMSRDMINENIKSVKESLCYNNATFWIVPVQGESRIEMLHPGVY